MPDQQIKQLSVKFMSVPVLINHIVTPGIQDAEITIKIPDGKPDTMTAKNIQYIAEPGQKNIMRCFIPASTFSAMHAHTLLYKICPGFVIFFQHVTAQVLITYLSRPFGIRHMVRVFIGPGRLIM